MTAPRGDFTRPPARGRDVDPGRVERVARAITGWWVGEPGHEITEDEAVELAESVVRALAADTGEAQQAVDRVRALCDAAERSLMQKLALDHDGNEFPAMVGTARIRAALDGD